LGTLEKLTKFLCDILRVIWPVLLGLVYSAAVFLSLVILDKLYSLSYPGKRGEYYELIRKNEGVAAIAFFLAHIVRSFIQEVFAKRKK
jgi:hypothetical protein